jgi:hypothetical protein
MLDIIDFFFGWVYLSSVIITWFCLYKFIKVSKNQTDVIVKNTDLTEKLADLIEKTQDSIYDSNKLMIESIQELAEEISKIKSREEFEQEEMKKFREGFNYQPPARKNNWANVKKSFKGPGKRELEDE